MAQWVKGGIRAILATGSGRAGSALLLSIVIVSLAVLGTFPLDFGLTLWSNPTVWADNPKAVPPAWIGLITGGGHVEHRVFEINSPETSSRLGLGKVERYSLDLQHNFERPPTLVSFSLKGVEYTKTAPLFRVSLLRPDLREVELLQVSPPPPRANEQPPYRRFQDPPLRVNMGADGSVASSLSSFLASQFGVSVAASELRAGKVESALFGKPVRGSEGVSYEVMRGGYRFSVEASSTEGDFTVGSLKLVLGGTTYGFMGTDSKGRDLAVGLLFGFPVALAIGLTASTLSTMVGAILGIFGGYVGGKTDTAIQRSSDILTNIPLLPILIFLAFVLGQKLWIVILLLVAFGWPGLAIVIRSMVLQIRSGQLIEAAVSIGASRSRIIFRHIFPQTAPFVFAQMIFLTPAAILAEAALSFLGLGDATIPTWGQILEQGFRDGGIYTGFWWWVLPPGLLIIMTAITFVLLALGLEPLVNPRLRAIR